MIIKKTKTNSGFVALMSAIVISAVLLLLTTNLSLTGFYDRSNILDGELKERSSALAEACVDTAILELANGITPPDGEVVNVGGTSPEHCTIVSVRTSGGQKIIKNQAKFNDIYTNLRIGINEDTFIVQSWEECPTLTNSNSTC